MGCRGWFGVPGKFSKILVLYIHIDTEYRCTLETQEICYVQINIPPRSPASLFFAWLSLVGLVGLARISTIAETADLLGDGDGEFSVCTVQLCRLGFRCLHILFLVFSTKKSGLRRRPPGSVEFGSLSHDVPRT